MCDCDKGRFYRKDHLNSVGVELAVSGSLSVTKLVAMLNFDMGPNFLK